MRQTLAGLLCGVGLCLAAGHRTDAQTIFLRPTSGSGPQRPGLNPFLIQPQTTPGLGFPGTGYPGVPGSAALGNLFGPYGNPFGPTTQFVDPALLARGLVPPPQLPPGSNIPPFSVVPPSQYFNNYQPYYPLLPGVGQAGTTLPVVGSIR